jgi:hypothetical protein
MYLRNVAAHARVRANKTLSNKTQGVSIQKALRCSKLPWSGKSPPDAHNSSPLPEPLASNCFNPVHSLCKFRRSCFSFFMAMSVTTLKPRRSCAHCDDLHLRLDPDFAPSNSEREFHRCTILL